MSTRLQHAMWMLAVVALQCGPALGAAQQPKKTLDELDDVLVSGAKLVKDPPTMRAWLKRLVGQYTFEGYVELGDEEMLHGRQKASGASKCVAYGSSPAVQCTIQVRWPDVKAEDGSELPGGVSMLFPAMILYGVDSRDYGIHSLLVDSAGMANGGLGMLRGDTLTTITPCVDLPGDCKRISRVKAQPDGKLIHWEIGIVRADVRTAHYDFQLRRVDEVKAPGK